jgi:ribosome-associated heat shock protein Hsp15
MRNLLMARKSAKQINERQKEIKSTTPEVRLDKWLQVARVYKTRSQAGEAIDGGLVKMDGRKAKAGRIIRINDKIEVSKRGRKLYYTVLGVLSRPVPAAEARMLYELKEEAQTLDGLSQEQREYMQIVSKIDRMNRDSRKGRPTKKDRRDLDRRTKQ